MRFQNRSALLAFAALTACGSAGRATTDAARPSDEPPPADEPRPAYRGYSEADVRFVHDMLVHHAQALEMTELVADRTTNERIRLLAERIEVSQADEIARLQDWLGRRGETLPDAHAGHGPGRPVMPGMLSSDELARLRGATADTFDRLFLEYMIRHHEGALAMVATLFATAGAGQEPELFQFASHVDADQRAEIARMRQMLNERG